MYFGQPCSLRRYTDLNLTTFPHIERVSTPEEAVELIKIGDESFMHVRATAFLAAHVTSQTSAPADSRKIPLTMVALVMWQFSECISSIIVSLTLHSSSELLHDAGCRLMNDARVMVLSAFRGVRPHHHAAACRRRVFNFIDSVKTIAPGMRTHRRAAPLSSGGAHLAAAQLLLSHPIFAS